MSLNPVATQLPPAAKEEPIGAFEVSKPKRVGEQIQRALVIPNQLIILNISASRRGRRLLSSLRGRGFRLRGHQAGFCEGGRIQRVLPIRGHEFH